MPRRKSKSNYKEGQKKIDSFVPQKEKVITTKQNNTPTKKYDMKNVQLFQDNWIESLKRQSREAGNIEIQIRKNWKPDEYRKINSFLRNNQIPFDISGEEFFKKWFNRDPTGVIHSEIESRESTIQEKKNEGIDRFHEMLYFFAIVLSKYSPSPNDLILYRGFTLSENDIKLLKQGKYPKGYEGLKIYWTWNPDTAFGDDPVNVRLIAKVKVNNVDWEETILLNSGHGLGEEENEVRLPREVPLQLIAIERIDEDMKALETIPISSKYKFRTDGREYNLNDQGNLILTNHDKKILKKLSEKLQRKYYNKFKGEYMWNKNMGTGFITTIQPLLNIAGYTVMITGSVGEGQVIEGKRKFVSRTDLDIILVPNPNRKDTFDFGVVYNFFDRLKKNEGWAVTLPIAQSDNLVVLMPDGRKVDFIL